MPSATDYNGGSQPFQIFQRSNLACPYFMPVEKLQSGAWPHPARLPLGGGWRGHCTAPGHEGEYPPQESLQAFCNLGYADGCKWAPRERLCGAVRFAVVAPSDLDPAEHAEGRVAGGDVQARVLRLMYVCERDHRPLEHGHLEFDLSRQVWLRGHNDARIQRMAECFLEAYLKKKA